jgi:hypothetical protein
MIKPQFKFKKPTKKKLGYAAVFLYHGEYFVLPTLKTNKKEAVNEAIDRVIAIFNGLRIK